MGGGGKKSNYEAKWSLGTSSLCTCALSRKAHPPKNAVKLGRRRSRLVADPEVITNNGGEGGVYVIRII